MAKASSPPPPDKHVLVRASPSQSCSTCQRRFAAGELVLSEAYVRDNGQWARSHTYARTSRPRSDDFDGDRSRSLERINPDLDARFHHLPCAASHSPFMLRSTLASTAFEVPDRAQLEELIEAALTVVDSAEADPSTRDEYHRFIEQLKTNPDERLERVFGDWCQSVGDPRGELIALQLAMAAADPAKRAHLAAVEQKLMATHRGRFVPDELGELVWRAGFVHRLELTTPAVNRVSLRRAFAHPSFRLLRELSTQKLATWGVVVAPNLPLPLSPSLRVLEVGNPTFQQGLGDMAAAVATASGLERLVLAAACELELRSTSMRVLELHCTDAFVSRDAGIAPFTPRTFVDRLPGLGESALPALERLVLRVDRGLDASLRAIVPALLRMPPLPCLVVRGDLTHAGIMELRHLKTLVALDVGGWVRTAADTEVLRALVGVKILTEAPRPAPAPVKVADWKVRHTRRPEWGMGIVVSESDAGLEVDFEAVGRKSVRNVELLEEVDDQAPSEAD